MRSLALIVVTCVGLAMAEVELVDLSHTFGHKTLYWPLNPPFNFSLAFRVEIAKGVTAVSYYFQTAEHSGTHMDAPRHFCEGEKTVHEVPLEAMNGPGVVLDFRKEAENDYDFSISLKQLKDWEAEHGEIPDGAIVLLRFGWDKYFGDWAKAFNSDNLKDTHSFHWPGLGDEASRWLIRNRKIRALGTDCPSPDQAQTKTFAVHVDVLCEAKALILENVANLGNLPVTGSQVYIGAIKLENGSGVPVRLFAVVGSATRIALMNVFVYLFLALLALFV